jgi:hypothetical protein
MSGSGAKAERWVIPNTEIVIEQREKRTAQRRVSIQRRDCRPGGRVLPTRAGLPYTRPVPLEYLKEITFSGGGG